MKLVFLGLDGLEYDFVGRWRLDNPKQQECGKIIVPIDPRIGVFSSPQVWATFLTGQHLGGLESKRAGFTGRFVDLLELIRHHVPLSMGLRKSLAKHTHKSVPKLDTATFEDKQNVTQIDAPHCSYDNMVFSVIQEYVRHQVPIDRARSKATAYENTLNQKGLCERAEVEKDSERVEGVRPITSE